MGNRHDRPTPSPPTSQPASSTAPTSGGPSNSLIQQELQERVTTKHGVFDLSDLEGRLASMQNARDHLDGGALAVLDDAAFRALFSGSPIKRIGRDRFMRNVLYAIGNSGEAGLGEIARGLTEDPDPAVADAARWAEARLRQ